MQTDESKRAWVPALVIGALGVVYGDIGTSPLYALRECFAEHSRLVPTPENVLGVLSLIFWSLIAIVSVKYLTFVMRASNKGEGGILALLALALPDRTDPGKRATTLIMLGIFGSALLYGDGIITPAVTVLSAVEGLTVVTEGMGSTKVSVSDLADLPSLASKLKQPATAVDRYLAGRFSDATQAALANYHGSDSDSAHLQHDLVQDLNAIIHGPSIYEVERFAGVHLREETKGLLVPSPQGDDVPRLNRRLLRDAYPAELLGSAWSKYVVPVSVVILVVLFAVQRHGTGRMGLAFGPVMVCWFVVLGVLGAAEIARAPEVLRAFNPWHGVHFFLVNGWKGFVVLGAVFLAVTGAEALYADMGHFGAKPIRQAWFGLVLPSLGLNYLGQGALLLTSPEAATNPFYLLAPVWARIPLVVLATMAAVIASQALISGAFSLTMQSVQLGFLPRLAVQHTSHEQRGQIYVPQANWILMVACVWLVLEFRSSSKLAAAYGVAVTMTMLITTILFFFAARRLWGWSTPKAACWTGLFLVIELGFCVANLLKIAHGGWVPLVIGLILYTIMTTWRTGRRLLRERLNNSFVPLETFLKDVPDRKLARVRGTAVFMSGNPEGTPIALLHNLKHNRVLHERNILLTVTTSDAAHVEPVERLRVQWLSEGFLRVVATYGFMDQPNVPWLLESCREHGLEVDPMRTTFFLSSETILPSRKQGMMIWRERLFAILSRNAQRATAFFGLPANRVVELGMQVEI